MSAITAIATGLGFVVLAGLALVAAAILLVVFDEALERPFRRRAEAKYLAEIRASMTPEREIEMLTTVGTRDGHASWYRTDVPWSPVFSANRAYFELTGYAAEVTGPYGGPVTGVRLMMEGRQRIHELLREHPELRARVKDESLLPPANDADRPGRSRAG